MRARARLALAWLTLVSVAATLACAESSESGQLAQANAALQAGEADKALTLLNALINSGGKTGAYNLRCRVELTLEQWDRAINDCEQATKLDGQNSDDHMWLARALGEKASRASFLSAYSLGKRVRIEFEEATRLNPDNAAALADLGQFYREAPSVLGGGVNLAEGMAARLDKLDPVRAHELRGGIAEQRKDYDAAEREFKQAIAKSPHPAFQWMTLAGFYRHRERWNEMESAVRSGQSAAERDKRASAALCDGANVLRSTNRDTARAAKMLEEYLASPDKTEEAPAFAAHTWLARLEEKLGDAAAASRERAAALALAHDYKPALDLKH
ncbi:MAG: tetratricopeptide repeat protein [Terracidiphilus sp.]